MIIATDTLDDFERCSFEKTVLMADSQVKVVFRLKELEAHICRGYSIIVKVHHLALEGIPLRNRCPMNLTNLMVLNQRDVPDC